MTLSPLRLDIAPLPAVPALLDMALLKQHLALDGDEFDALLEQKLRAAMLWAEGAMHRTVVARSHVWVLGEFPRGASSGIRLPRGKTQAVESIVYSAGGAPVLLSAYQQDLGGEDGGVLLPPRGGAWPSADLDVPRPVAITFIAGWLPGELPADIADALFFAVHDAFDLRGSAEMTSTGSNLFAREALVSAYRLKRWY